MDREPHTDFCATYGSTSPLAIGMMALMVVGFSEQFRHFLVPSSAETEQTLKHGLIVLDTNVLLSAYRFAPKAREELLSVLERLQDRVWVPHQVGLEFHRNRFEVIADQAAAYDAVLAAISEYEKTSTSELADKVHQLANRVALAEKERTRLTRLVSDRLQPLTHEIEKLRNSHELGKPSADDAILERLQLIFRGKVGPPLTGRELEDAQAEAKRRIEANEPPGYEDSKKVYPYGDYLMWAQTLQEVQRRSVAATAIVTDDTKSDWYRRVKGQLICGRPELIEEAQTVAKTRLQLMPIQSMLRHAARYLDAKVSDETLAQAGQLPEPRVNPHLRAMAKDYSAMLSSAEGRLARERGRIDSLRHDVQTAESLIPTSPNAEVIYQRLRNELVEAEDGYARSQAQRDHLVQRLERVRAEIGSQLSRRSSQDVEDFARRHYQLVELPDSEGSTEDEF